MTLLLNPSTNEVIQAQPQLWQISVERYHEMIAAGLLTEDDRLELLEGYLVEKMTINPPPHLCYRDDSRSHHSNHS